VLGHSWGGMLAMAYAIIKPPGLVSLLVHGSLASMPFALAEVDKLRASLQPVLCLALLSRKAGQEGIRRAPGGVIVPEAVQTGQGRYTLLLAVAAPADGRLVRPSSFRFLNDCKR